MHVVIARLGLAFLAIGFGLWHVIDRPFYAAWPILGGALLIYGHFRYGTVWFAFRALKKGDLDGAGRLILAVRKPEWLGREYLAYYHWTRGALDAAAQRLDEAHRHFLAAMEGSLRTPKDRAVVCCCLAELAARQGRVDEAENFMMRAREASSDPVVETLIGKVRGMIDAGMEKAGGE